MNDKLKICEACEKYKREEKLCSVCGCYMPIKTVIPLTSCPEGKW